MKIRFLTGTNKDKLFSVQKNVVLSRTTNSGDIAILDSQASNPHAKIIKKGNLYYLKDLDSKNGTYLDNKTNNYFPLKHGLQFQIGSTVLQVIDPPPAKKTSIKNPSWVSTVIKELKKNQLKIKDQQKLLEIIQPALVLKFKSGIQKSDSWVLHYGPRQAGRACLDLPILDPQAPDICFSLHPLNNQVLFKTPYPEKVLINNKFLSEKILQNKDKISFSNTCIEISFSKK